ncbi:hypothetical protein DPMN_078311 [Dreissena polymorpha]|uniref:Uncharacterized protein n=1 Tax=Dreissena polymorpha TaxID=45954 RepID=A0A9D4BP23_DREPO|nr:hypothetical protein DPMN_078311 [Dreissena polymorpha]
MNELYKINFPTPGGHVFRQTGRIFELIQNIIKTNVQTKCYEDWTIHLILRVKNATPPGGHVFNKPASRFLARGKCPAPYGHVFKVIKTILQLVQDIFRTNLLTKFHDERKNALRPGGHVFQQTRIILKLTHMSFGTYVLTKFHKDRTIHLTSWVFTRTNAPSHCGHVIQPTGTIFELVQDIFGTNLLFHEDRTINVASRVLKSHLKKMPRPPGGHYFQSTRIIFKLVQYIIGKNLLTKFYNDRTIHVASRVKNAPSLWRQYIIETNRLTKDHEDRTIKYAQRTMHDGRRTKSDNKSSP